MIRRLIARRARAYALAWSTIRGRRNGFVATFLAVAAGAAVVTACGILLETGLRSGVPAERYQAAAVVVGAEQALPVADDVDPRFAERVRLPAALVDKVARVPGVEAAVGDLAVRVSVVTADGDRVEEPDGRPLRGHGWQTHRLGEFRLTAGEAPGTAEDVVLEAALAQRAGIAVGHPVTLAVGSTSVDFRVSGLVTRSGGELSRESALFLTEDRVRELAGQPDRVDAIGVLAGPEADPDALAAEISRAVPGVVTYTGDRRSDAESLQVGEVRTFVVELALSFGATMVAIVVLVVASTLALSVQQRRRELAMLRAVGATPRQVLSMVGAEATVVSVAAAIFAALPGIGLGVLLHWALTAIGLLPAGFALSFGVLPVLAATVLCVLAARLGGWVAARRAAKVSPMEALGEASVEPRRLGWVRLTLGALLLPVALAAAVLAPITLPGEAAVDGAASSAFLLVVAVALLGPRLLGGAVAVLGPWLNRGPSASGFLATANARARTRRLSAATTTLIMGVTMAAAQIFSAATADAAATTQAAQGVTAAQVVTATSAGLSPELADLLRDLPEVAAVTPVVRTQTIATYRSGDSEEYRVYAAQGLEVTPNVPLERTVDLGVLSGDLADLRGGTVALSRIAAGTLGVEVGDEIDLRLGDGTATAPRVVAVYERGLGFGDVTLPYEVAIAHVTDGLAAWMLVAAADSTGSAELGESLRSATAEHPTVTVTGSDGFLAAQSDVRADDSVVVLIFTVVLLGYIAIAVVNTLVMATAERRREFATLRLIGATPAQVRQMMSREAKIIVVAAVVIGLLAALPALCGVSVALTGSPVPSITLPGLAAIAAGAALVAWPAIMIATRAALTPPARPIMDLST